MKLELIQLLSTDKLKLPGLLYTPEKRTKKAAIWLHGMGESGIFYNPQRTNALGQALTDQGITLLSFNNRGAGNTKSLAITDSEDRFQGGTNYEVIADCVKDIDGAVQFLKDKKYNEFYLLGHSSGANKICVYNQTAPKNPFSKFVLAGPGDDIGLLYSSLGKDLFTKALNLARDRTKQGNGAQSTYDLLNPNGSYNTFPYYEATTERLGNKVLFKEYRQIRIPTLVVLGENDEGANTAGSVSDALIMFEDNSHSSIVNSCGFLTIPETDHGFHGSEEKFAKSVASWLAREY
jgi:pimeloyl-ACP methyl ester carboxylesterase